MGIAEEQKKMDRESKGDDEALEFALRVQMHEEMLEALEGLKKELELLKELELIKLSK